MECRLFRRLHWSLRHALVLVVFERQRWRPSVFRSSLAPCRWLRRIAQSGWWSSRRSVVFVSPSLATQQSIWRSLARCSECAPPACGSRETDRAAWLRWSYSVRRQAPCSQVNSQARAARCAPTYFARSTCSNCFVSVRMRSSSCFSLGTKLAIKMSSLLSCASSIALLAVGCEPFMATSADCGPNA